MATFIGLIMNSKCQQTLEKTIKSDKLIVANENTSHLSLRYFIVLTDKRYSGNQPSGHSA